jgi:hemerythrin-like domain-containing protein
MQISNYLIHEHRECDDFFAKAEELASRKSWEEAEKAFLEFADKTLLHFKKEEEELFPLFEELTGSSDGPTQVMRYEHDQVRGLFGKMAEAVEKRDMQSYLSLSESMMILLQQHNMKEEQMLYAMCDRMMPMEKKSEVIERMEALKE